MNRIVRVGCDQNILLYRRLSAQAGVKFKPKDEEYINAAAFKSIPGLSKFEFLRRFLPGGKFHKASFIDIHRALRNELGNFYRLPGVFGQKTLLITFDADDIELIFRNEGTYPYRRGMETMRHYRQNIRNDIYEVGGLINE